MIINQALKRQIIKKSWQDYDDNYFINQEIMKCIVSHIEMLGKGGVQVENILLCGKINHHDLSIMSNNIVFANFLYDNNDNDTNNIKTIDIEVINTIASNSIDICIVHLILDYIDDLEAWLSQVHRILKKDGVFISAFLGGKTLYSLRNILYSVDADHFSTVYSRIMPNISLHTITALLYSQRFKNIITDSFILQCVYAKIQTLMNDIATIPRQSYSMSQAKVPNMNELYFNDLTMKYKEIYGEITTDYEIISFYCIK